MADHECLKGWILSPSPTDGEYVPYFVYVRDKDIIWNENNIQVKEKIKELVNLGVDKELYYPSAYWKLDYDGWKVEISSDGTYKATRKLNVAEDCTELNPDTKDEVLFKIKIPFDTEFDDSFGVNITLLSQDNTIKASSTGLSNVYKDPNNNGETSVFGAKSFDTVEIFIKNTLTKFNESEFSTLNGKYKSSYVLLEVKGKLSL